METNTVNSHINDMGTNVNAKQRTRIGCWNVQTMYEGSRSAQIAKEAKSYKLEILGMSEACWNRFGKTVLQNEMCLIY
jgi:hypothetical protein